VKKRELREIVADVLRVDPELLGVDVVLTSLTEFDSMSVLLLMLALDERAGIRVAPTDAGRLQRYGDIEELALRRGIALTD
jgi:acyl carrier protein